MSKTTAVASRPSGKTISIGWIGWPASFTRVSMECLLSCRSPAPSPDHGGDPEEGRDGCEQPGRQLGDVEREGGRRPRPVADRSRYAPDPPECPRAGLHPDTACLWRDLDLAPVGHVQRIVRPERAVGRTLEPGMRELRGRPLDAVDREVDDGPALHVDADDLVADGRCEPRRGHRSEVAEQGDERVAGKAEASASRKGEPIRGGVRRERDEWLRRIGVRVDGENGLAVAAALAPTGIVEGDSRREIGPAVPAALHDLVEIVVVGDDVAIAIVHPVLGDEEATVGVEVDPIRVAQAPRDDLEVGAIRVTPEQGVGLVRAWY